MKKDGFTLMEIMVSVAVLSIGLVLIVQSYVFCLNALRICDNNLAATLTIDNKMAEAELLAKEDWEKFREGLREESEFADLQYSWQIELEPVPWPDEDIPEGYQGLKKVEASLNWRQGRRKGEIPIVTLIRGAE